ncbi:MAG: B12-binding domain-containing radical SAM protein [Pseudomonadota bacterium]
MRILLVRPRPDRETIGLQNVMICEPLELEYLCSAISGSGHETEIIDMILEKRPIGYFIEKYKPDAVAITAYISHINTVKTYAAAIKKVDRDCKVIVGGVHAEVIPEDFADENIDFIVQGNGLNTFRGILEALDKGAKDYDVIEGVWKEGKPRCCKETVFNHPLPDREKVSRYRHRYYYMFHNPCALMKTSFGCPYSCSFCFCRQITDGNYFTRDLREVIEELKEIKEEEVYIVDDDFLVDRSRVMEFCSLLSENGLKKKFLIYGRADFIAWNEDVIRCFAANGLRAVIVGLESCQQEELAEYNKHSSVAVNEKAVSVLRNAGVECYATLILGLDWQDREFDNLYRWLRKLDLKFINLQPFTPLPGTPLYDEYKAELAVSRQEHEKWDLAHLVVKPRRISARRYYWNIVKLYYKITMNPRNIIKMIRQYGLTENIKLSLGAMNITLQYLKKIVREA